MRPSIRAAEPTDASWIEHFLRERWGATTTVVHGESIDAALLPALIAGDRVGLVTYRPVGDDAELVTINADPPGEGTGTALLEALVERLKTHGCPRLWLTTTNDNLRALRFYMRRSFRMVHVRFGAVDQARKVKPSIPMVGEYGIPIHDEIDLCRALGPATMPRSPWRRG
jgi:GNAT superfamily N-acetyltransferase